MHHHITMTQYLRFRRTICLNSSLWNPIEYWGHLNGQQIWVGSLGGPNLSGGASDPCPNPVERYNHCKIEQNRSSCSPDIKPFRYWACPGMPQAKINFFFRKSPNGSIHKVKWLKTESEHLLQNLPTTGVHRLSLNFSAKNEIKVLIHFIDFVWFDLSDNAYSVR